VGGTGKMNIEKLAVIIIILAGTGLIITAFFDSPVQLQIISALVGAGLICLGLMQLKHARDTRQNEERFGQIIDKLEIIEKELEKIEQPKGGGVAIADVLASGLKYYTKHMSPPKEEEEK
jgi:hypothetical protein